ncbi:MAG TPA: hypothetical protein VMS76_04445 [Planctomycetota bacterium]|nr:hypothetical protein [Planctomycetota bacterium]
MVRSQTELDAELHRRARRRAAELGISFAEYLRRLVARDLDPPAKRTDPKSVFDLGRSGGTNVGRHKDALLGASLAAEQAPRPDRQ